MESRSLKHIVLTFCWILLSSAVYADSAVVLPIATGEWPPFVMADAPDHGSFVATLRQALAPHGLTVQLAFTSWPRAQALAESGKVFAAMPYFYNAERAARFDFSLPVVKTRTVIFYLVDAGRSLGDYSEPADLAEARVAAVPGYWYEPLLKKNGATISYASDETAAFRVLLAGRADAVIQDESVGWYLINHDFAAQAKRLATSNRSFGEADQPLMLMVSRKYPGATELLKRVNAALASLPANEIGKSH